MFVILFCNLSVTFFQLFCDFDYIESKNPSINSYRRVSIMIIIIFFIKTKLHITIVKIMIYVMVRNATIFCNAKMLHFGNILMKLSIG